VIEALGSLAVGVEVEAVDDERLAERAGLVPVGRPLGDLVVVAERRDAIDGRVGVGRVVELGSGLARAVVGGWSLSAIVVPFCAMGEAVMGGARNRGKSPRAPDQRSRVGDLHDATPSSCATANARRARILSSVSSVSAEAPSRPGMTTDSGPAALARVEQIGVGEHDERVARRALDAGARDGDRLRRR
jgi:hypothetical protein